MSEYFSLSECDVIGFDLDHTLCRYHLKETSRLIYESFARYLVEHKGYDKDLLTLSPATWDFCFKGLVVDLEDGNLIKLAQDGTVLRASHGTRHLSTEEIIKHYGPKREWKHFESLNTSYTRSAKYYFYDNYFDLPGALLCAKVVDMLHKRGSEVTVDLWKDMVAAIDHNYNTSAFKVNDVEESEGLPSLEKPGWYSQGNWPHLHELLKTMTGKPEPKVVYFGDSMRSDMFPASSYGKWETVMIVEELEGEGVQRNIAAKPAEPPLEPLGKKVKYEDQGMKTPSAASEQWGSYFVDAHRSESGEDEVPKLTWCSYSIHTYSTVAIPSVEAIADLPLDYKFPRFSPDKPTTTGYFPRPPDSLLKMYGTVP
ncbi:5'-nucleotidase domain-containing protein 1 isoform X2 [Scleropages formosus]|uniref:5'-nucleotidase domain-containing protein 1 isoform X2 n=1 Tax=Scleropages formosus TaxID=113540 RepID=UPI0010FA6C01|nr:5'-nucleotidase domain-containing protein 1 isoform X2 [Scleropages formosus]